MSPPEALFEWYCDTLWRLRHDFLIAESDEDEVWDDFYEDADIGLTSCFHIDNLRRMEAAGLLDAVAVEEGAKIRKLWLALMEDELTRTCSAVRTLPEWTTLLSRCASLRKLTCPEVWQ